MKRLFLLLIMICSLAVSCIDPVVEINGGISGIVVDEISQQALSGVRVSLVPSGSSVITGYDGGFSFEDLEDQEYSVSFTKDGYISQIRKVSVKAGLVINLQVSMIPIVPELDVTPASLDFGNDLTTLAIDIVNKGKGNLEWTLSEDISWLSCTPSKGVTANESSSVVVSVDRKGLMEIGSYNGTIVVSSNGGSCAIPVSVVFGALNLSVSPSELDFGTLENSMKLTLMNTGTGVMKYSSKSMNDWLVLSKESGTFTEFDSMTAIVVRDRLSAGTYTSSIIFSTDMGDVTVPVTMKVSVNEKPVVTMESIDKVTFSSASFHGTVVSAGSSKVTRYGFCWSEKPNPTIEDFKSNIGDTSTPVAFESTAVDLKSDTKYHVRAYAENNVGLIYSEKELSFTTGSLPEPPGIASGEVSKITQTTAEVSGTITSLGNVDRLTAYGHVWSTSPNPTLEDGIKSDHGETFVSKSYVTEMKGLKAHTKYYVKAYATNEKGTRYGSDVTFFTENSDVIISTVDVTDIIHNEATCGGKIEDDGGYSIVEKGVCWSTNKNPTVEHEHVKAGTDFTCRITGLSKLTAYYVRAYAMTSEGKVFYGDNKYFKTTEEVSLPALSDVTLVSVGRTKATVKSYIENDGNSRVVECGFCWSVSPLSTVNDNKIVSELNETFSAELVDLPLLTKVYVRAYARNAMGINYSPEISFETINADTDAWKGESALSFGGGIGTEDNPVIINAANQLKLLSDKVNAGTTYEGIYFKLTVNIDLKNRTWNSIGTSSFPFKGSFDGNGHFIKGLKTNRGLFGFVSGGDYIKNLTISGVVEGVDKVGGLCAEVNDYKTIDNCHSDCKVRGGSMVGGLVGSIICKSTGRELVLSNCSNSGMIEGEESVGGLIGYINCQNSKSDKTTTLIMSNNLNLGHVHASETRAGGLVGEAYHYRSNGMAYCYVNNCVNCSNVSGSVGGGLVGYASTLYGTKGAFYVSHSYWLNDIVGNFGLEKGIGSGSKIQVENALYYTRTNNACILLNGEDLVSILNQWIDNSIDLIEYRRWEYLMKDGYSYPSFK